MCKKIIFIIMINMVLVSINVSGLSISIEKSENEVNTTFSGDGSVLYVGGNGPGNFSKIKNAVNAASSGDTIFVYSGTYNEYDIKIEINDLKIVGENPETTIVNSNNNAKRATFEIFQVSNIVIKNFTVKNTDIESGSLGGGIWLPAANDCEIVNNICFNHKGQAAIRISGKRNIIANNVCYDNKYAIEHGCNGKTDTYNIFHDNNCYDNNRGLYILRGCKNQIYDNGFTNNKVNIKLSLANDNSFTNNMCASTYDYGIYLDRCNNNIFQDNDCQNDGITLYYSKSIQLIGNQFKKGVAIIGMYEDELCSHYMENNHADGKPIVFYKDIDGSSISIPEDACQIILVNCNDFTITGFDFSNVYSPIQLGFCSNIEISSNTIHSIYRDGICLFNSNNNIISNNIIEYVENEAISLWNSKNNDIFENEITHNEYGIYLCGLLLDEDEIHKAYQYNNIHTNHFENNECCLYFYRNCWRNNIYHNNIIDNYVGVFTDPAQGNIYSSPSNENNFYDNNFRRNNYHSIENCDNTWYNTDTLKGNYWDDFLWTDTNPKDDICDIPYELSEMVKDEYPLIFPWGIENTPPEKPTIEGPTSGKPEESNTYTMSSHDADDGDGVHQYIIDWGDGDITWYTLTHIDSNASVKHTYKSGGKYEIKVKATDKHDVQSVWSDPYQVSISKSKAKTYSKPLLRNFENYPFLFNILYLVLRLLNLS